MYQTGLPMSRGVWDTNYPKIIIITFWYSKYYLKVYLVLKLEWTIIVNFLFWTMFSFSWTLELEFKIIHVLLLFLNPRGIYFKSWEVCRPTSENHLK